MRHHRETSHSIDFDNVEIIDTASNDLKLQWKEMIHIRTKKPSFNVQENSELFTLIIRNALKTSDKTRDIQNYIGKNKNLVASRF